MLLSNADKIYYGAAEASKVYYNGQIVWSSWDGIIHLTALSMPTITPDTSVIAETPVTAEPDSGLACLVMPTLGIPNTKLAYPILYNSNGADVPTDCMTGGTSSAETTMVAHANAVDDDTGTQWRANSSAATGWWQYDLGVGNEKTFRWMNLYVNGTGAWKDFYVMASNNGTNFDTLGTFRTVYGGWLCAPIENSTSYRYYRLKGISKWNSTGWQPVINELEMFEWWPGDSEYWDLIYYNVENGHTVIANKYLKSEFSFDCWNTQADGSGDNYNPTDVIYPTEPIVLYAQWIDDLGKVLRDQVFDGYKTTLDDDLLKEVFGR